MVQCRFASAVGLGRIAGRDVRGRQGDPMTDRLFEAYLQQHDDAAWARVIDNLSASIHPVDRNATRIWFAFFPLSLLDVLREAPDRDWLVRKLQMLGNWELRGQIDVSHRFLYGHRWWPQVKQAVAARAHSDAPPASLELGDQILELASGLAAGASADRALLVGITAVALMTVQQVGLEAFAAAPGAIELDAAARRLTPDEVLRARARDDGQGVFGFLKGERKTWTVTFDEQDRTASFPLINSQHLTTAAAADTRPHRTRDSRCTEGPIPVECRTASCGTCWVGILGGAEKLSPMEDHERRRLREFGYLDTAEERPIIRLSCQAQAFGAVSIVIPPWNGIFGKYVEKRRQTAGVQ
jgi:ferredoxin